MAYGNTLTTGFPGLDRALNGILPGDNIVWQVASIEDYMVVVKLYADAWRESGRRLVYFRFASHAELIPEESGAEIHRLRPEDGFESFIARIHSVIERVGRGALYVFDCLSELAADWYSDQMLGNFFKLTCPYLYDLETVAYFAIFRNHHSAYATRPIMETTQIFLELYRHNGQAYIHPTKVQYRYSPTVNMLHAWVQDELRPVTSSALISEILTSVNWLDLHSENRPGVWQRTFAEAHKVRDGINDGSVAPEKGRETFSKLARMVISRDPDMLKLVDQYMTLDDILNIRRRLIGTGLVGGKTVGMLLARKILASEDNRYVGLLEQHDSFYIGSDVFYTFLVVNGVWWVRQKQRNTETFLEGAEQARQRIITGTFPEYIVKELEQVLDYFGQSPIIVRSSSLLEDNFGNSFAGKYESVFCPNQGPRERRLDDFLSAIRTVYASSMGEKALRYRERRRILDHDEQMALLIMRVSGAMHGRYFYPHSAGVAFSFNPYAWSKDIDPQAGVVRLVFGLGTRAVDRSDDDYTRIVALNAPNRRPESNFEEVRQYAQRRVDYLDLDINRLVSGDFTEVIRHDGDLPLQMFASQDSSADYSAQGPSTPAGKRWVLTFDSLLGETRFVTDMQDILGMLQKAYNYPVDVEFTLNFVNQREYRINLVQCRPLPVHGGELVVLPKIEIRREDRLIEAHGAVVGNSRLLNIDRLVYVVPRLYGQLPQRDRYEIARLIGRVNHARGPDGMQNIAMIGPGRWGTSTPSLGIPVNFADINRASVLCEIVAMREDLVPDVSLGTHFLNELVEMDMLYLALFPGQGDNYLNEPFFEKAPNSLAIWVLGSDKWSEIVKVIDGHDVPNGRKIAVVADALSQFVIFHLATGTPELHR